MNAIVDQARSNVRANGLDPIHHKNLPMFTYNDELDRKNYTVKDFMIDRLNAVHTHLELPDGGEWVYFATIHGVIFKYNTLELRPRTITQLDASDFKFFTELSNVRYIDVQDDSFSFALTHYENEVPA